jgi:hypothetical protein
MIYEELIDKIRDDLLNRIDLVMDEDDELQDWIEEWYGDAYGHRVRTEDLGHFLHLESKIARDVTDNLVATLSARADEMRRGIWQEEGDGK